MKILFSGLFPVQARHGFICGVGYDGPAADGFQGQRNGLLGVAESNCILMYFGCHTARVDMEVKLYEERPPIEDKWEEVVEASFLARAEVVETGSRSAPPHESEGVKLSLCPFLTPISFNFFYIPEGSYRLRYCVKNYGALESDDENFPDQHEYYEMSFWPAPMGSEEIIRITKDRARWRHESQQKYTALGL